VLDTQDLTFYKQCIDFADWNESEARTDEAFIARSMELIQLLEKADFPIDLDSMPLLQAEEITKNYGGKRFNLGAITLTIQQGDIWGLVGENGNGKTTLLRILASELAYTAGKLTYGLTANSTFDLRTKLAYIPQRTPKWYGSLKSNLKYAASHYGLTGERNELTVLMYIIRFGLWKFRHHNWDELSSGYKMRFELARTFLRSPKLLLLDEPLANLDVLAQQLILEDLKNLSQSLSNPLGIILSSQQLFEVEKVSDKILFLKNGVPTHLTSANEEKQDFTIIELDILNSREELNHALKHFEIQEIKFNGGIYIVTIPNEGSMNAFMQTLIDHSIQIRYVRDISHSTRRLFI
jgi:ABC-2 type transport system ATP-binding protein